MAYVRQATITDADKINELSRFLGYSNTTSDEAQQRLAYLLESTNDDVWVCEVNGHIAGWLHGFKAHRLASDMFYEIGGLVVDTKVRKQGVGKLLVGQAYQYAQQLNLELRVRCNSKRVETHEFYNRLGFTQAKQQSVFSKR
ncbi:GNAT family N-acetyltransferase [Pseudoalteromonas luteoviolacea]|uniref:N-acetyltransferase domain-containing protein n=1 Tax=Pseudoalteromonas luteoviolacea S4054 TaxID=1129367 RepID=A0A0F6A7G2_9GAMM|nr:GNAT family N-acetyltransferase [Pseudoalteromonas luteoviolacea]AOT10407.1 hypothetical protein S4054249_21280 [Pseudoalteromonas luteoviolacea]AOT15523.1 hypothetical protein S40542_22310 [Pseudoalteromonas luteoviolacea]AOT20226.1 hypothetical protein S4054_21195 [Pseudoalteromonas luteoviolacea]KKE82172.1 hypothetical protein N479_19405 [Pseudoalteromonas luteoviolacea S4054]KZN69694.1 hypothetical protein N481_21840 [Pseudoalteromonas luteoviolacea S4047-1]